jgi:hypothetical protein
MSLVWFDCEFGLPTGGHMGPLVLVDDDLGTSSSFGQQYVHYSWLTMTKVINILHPRNKSFQPGVRS